MRMYGIQMAGVIGYVINTDEAPPYGAWLADYNPEGHDGYGDALWTDDVNQALLFDDPAACHALWTRVPTNRPTRADGEANRPLCAYNIAIVPVEVLT